MKKILFLVCMFVLSFGLMSCGKDGSGSSDIYMVEIHYPGQQVLPVGTGTSFSVTVIKNGEPIDSSNVSISTFKDSGVGNLRIWNDGGTIDFQGDKISKKYGEITDCKFGAVSGTGEFGLKATYKGTTATVTFSTN